MDPTAFDNLKTVVEGAIYDLDLDGTVVVTDRRDWLDLAHFSRTYQLSFRLQEAPDVTCTVVLHMHLKEIARELLQQADAGCELTITFCLPVESDAICPHIEETMHNIWGETRLIRQTLRRDYASGRIDNDVTIEFGRLIREDNVNDLLEMVPYMLESLQQLCHIA
ncbi:hypothetical protein [Anoxybacteroides amylolyticum]|uniref:Group-specific protein n=1 Tax=Anoxybacteroides amylolyticum TaxID=294699 RepID=A0A160F5J1_9BACL|nr:hypothetical protein [Anoxybacillus amylolyticus]ANB61787.1 hypothetical protein GFC30_2100 [Anoxybacillus amylolyticus]